MKKVVSIGGGHGLSMILRTLLTCNVDQTAIVSVADDGGSSGRLRQDLDIVAPGDIRSCLLALSQCGDEDIHHETILAKLFNYRFDKGELDGHSLGNLILVALARELHSFEAAVEQASMLLNVRGKVLPATESNVVLCAETEVGLVRGQVNIEHSKGIDRIFLDPSDAKPLTGVVEAIGQADHIIYAPGSLFTSIIPVFIIPEITRALQSSSADKTMILNLTTKGPDTDGLTGDDHLIKVLDHNGKVDRVVCDHHSLQIEDSYDSIQVINGDIRGSDDSHDPHKLRQLLVDVLAL